MSGPDERAKALLSKMLNLKLFVILWHGKDKDIMPMLADHLEYLIALERQGKVFASGPMGAPEKRNGMTIVRVDSEAEAREIAENDPFAKAGLRDFTIEPWTIMEGSLSVRVNFSEGTGSIG